MESQIQRIREGIILLKKLDKNYEIFGSDSHKYILNKKVKRIQLKLFEFTHNITFPTEYKLFLTEIGNGGAGPYYGLERYENGLFVDLDKKNIFNRVNISKPFPHTQKWNISIAQNMNLAEIQMRNRIYYDKKWINGVMRISNFGCGIFYNLVICGQEAGNVWIDDRCNGGGIYPELPKIRGERIKFLDWYENWLDESLKEIKSL